jgi:hypothetical protein
LQNSQDLNIAWERCIEAITDYCIFHSENEPAIQRHIDSNGEEEKHLRKQIENKVECIIFRLHEINNTVPLVLDDNTRDACEACSAFVMRNAVKLPDRQVIIPVLLQFLQGIPKIGH